MSDSSDGKITVYGCESVASHVWRTFIDLINGEVALYLGAKGRVSAYLLKAPDDPQPNISRSLHTLVRAGWLEVPEPDHPDIMPTAGITRVLLTDRTRELVPRAMIPKAEATRIGELCWTLRLPGHSRQLGPGEGEPCPICGAEDDLIVVRRAGIVCTVCSGTWTRAMPAVSA